MNFLAWKYRIYNYYQDKKMIIIINVFVYTNEKREENIKLEKFLKPLTITENIIETNNIKYTIEKSDRVEINEKRADISFK